MWERAQLKSRAKEVLRISYWKAFLVSLLLAFVGGNEGIQTLSFNWNMNNNTSGEFNGNAGNLFNFSSGMAPFLIMVFLSVIFMAFLFVLAFRFFLAYPLEVGGKRYFIHAAHNSINLNNLSYSFNKGIYANIVKAMIWRAFFIFLWTLLFIIPGIIKSYAYRMVPYILADNPNISYQRAIELSEQMTRGHKFDIFILDLSFIGWYFLGAIAFGVGILFVIPYQNSTNAELYLVLKQNALNAGMCNHEELGIYPYVQEEGF
jgi:uncharacterized membrane protein